jgi:hypothetical protein
MFSKTVRILALGLSVGSLGLVLQACSDASSTGDEGNVDKEQSALCTEKGCDVTVSKCKYVYAYARHGNSKFFGNTRLVPIDINTKTAPCVSNNGKGERATCQLDLGAIDWVETKGGVGYYARGGQTVSIDGSKDSAQEWTLTTPYTLDRYNQNVGYVTCVDPASADAEGVPADTALAAACVVETMNASTNVTGLMDRNVATLEVCTSSYPHPDGAALSREYWTGSAWVYCYKGDGAGLNDANGTERDAYGVYLPGSDACHVLWSNGYEVAGAKRPSTKAFPSPGVVVPTTALIWRPVNDAVQIAN